MFNRSTKIFAIAGIGLIGAAGSASALEAVTASPVTVYTAPEKAAASIAVAPAASVLSVEGCLADAPWCEVAYDGKTGWVPADQLGVKTGAQLVMLSERPAGVTVKTVTYQNGTKEGQGAAALAGVGTGAAAGAAVGGPAGAVIGALIGGVALGEAAKPTTETVTWVEKNPVAPVYLSGDVVEGAVLPDAVTLTPVPDSSYAYVNVNEHPVLVNPDNRQIVYIVK
ncbi:MAG: DUF1236 domain-containing protein [Paenirhodobacter sp.]|uniref:DUF1236 domain-containing protein n=1 Tax=Paenirhodobacter sp. TaxID=1965326 RepID=UPI003D10F2D5